MTAFIEKFNLFPVPDEPISVNLIHFMQNANLQPQQAGPRLAGGDAKTLKGQWLIPMAVEPAFAS